jgi:hypothetical protein
MAVEIDDKSLDYLLPAKMKSCNSSSTNSLPKHAFRKRHASTQFLCSRNFDRVQAVDGNADSLSHSRNIALLVLQALLQQNAT